jgi:tRNA pseudouridine55 synthase
MENKTGFLLVDKPEGPTSHDMVDRLRRISKIKKIGHAGTLDPFASGLLILAIGRESTKKIALLAKMDKEYLAKVRFGAVSDTYDRTGLIKPMPGTRPTPDKLRQAAKQFLGRIDQVPPMYSAKKVKGRKLYDLARKGVEIERRPSSVEVYKLQIISYDWPFLEIRVACSTGTYIRSLAHDLGQVLGCGGYLEELRRTRIGLFSVQKAVPIDKLDEANWTRHLISPDTLLALG